MDAKKPLLALVLAAKTAQAAGCANYTPEILSVINTLLTIGGPTAYLMIIYMGIKWYMAEGPEERDNARRGIIYVVIGLLMLRGGMEFVHYLLCF